MISDFASKKNATVALHNDLINTCYTMSTFQLRLFKTMLFNLNREHTKFSVMSIPNSEFVVSNASGSRFESVKNSTKNIHECLVNGQEIFELVEYTGYGGYMNVCFAPVMEKYLLGLDQNSVKQGNWTGSRVEEIKKIKTFAGFRIYWLLKQYLNFKGNSGRTISLSKLKDMLGMSDKYSVYQNFKKKVLDVVQEELSETDVAFTYDVTRVGRSIDSVKFFFKKSVVVVDDNEETQGFGDWSLELGSIGITRNSMVAINALLQENIISTDYIEYCVIHYKALNAKKKINTSLKGAIYSAIMGQYLTDDFKAYKKRKSVNISAKAASKPVAEHKAPVVKDDTSVIASKHWADCQEYIKTFVGEQSYNSFFAPIQALEYIKKDKVLTLNVPNMLIYEWIEEHYLDVLRDALVNVIGDKTQVEYVVTRS